MWRIRPLALYDVVLRTLLSYQVNRHPRYPTLENQIEIRPGREKSFAREESRGRTVREEYTPTKTFHRAIACTPFATHKPPNQWGVRRIQSSKEDEPCQHVPDLNIFQQFRAPWKMVIPEKVRR